MEIRPVRSHHEKEIFLTFPWRIYRDDPLWVPPLLAERRKATDPARGADCLVCVELGLNKKVT